MIGILGGGTIVNAWVLETCVAWPFWARMAVLVATGFIGAILIVLTVPVGCGVRLGGRR